MASEAANTNLSFEQLQQVQRSMDNHILRMIRNGRQRKSIQAMLISKPRTTSTVNNNGIDKAK